MRASIFTLLGLFLFVGGAQAQTAFQNFSWRADSRFELKIVQNGEPLIIKGELRDGATVTVPSKDQTVSVELKSYTTELFLVVAVTTATDENGSIFLLERPNADWLLMNDSPIRARKLGLMKDFEGVMEAFKAVSNFGIAQSMRKMAEYFEVNPGKRLNDLYDSLEKGEDFVRALPKPRTSARSQGVVQPEIPKTRYVDPNSSEEPAGPQEEIPREELRPEDLPSDSFEVPVEEPTVNRPSNKRRKTREVQPDYIDPNGFPAAPPPLSDEDWVAQERARQRQWLREEKRRNERWQQQQRRQQRRQPRYDDPFSQDPFDTRPSRRRPQYQQPEYYGDFPPPPVRRRNFFDRLFGN